MGLVNLAVPVPDFKYMAARINGACTYRLSGFRGTNLFPDVNICEGQHADQSGTGRNLGVIDMDDVPVDERGYFSLIMSAERPAGYQGHWVRLEPTASFLLVRHAAHDWLNEVDCRMAIERLDIPAPRPRATVEQISEGLGRVPYWTDIVMEHTVAHKAVQSHSPQSLGFALNDLPAGFAAGLIERRRAWSDCNGELESVFPCEFLLTTVSLYWFTQTFHTSARFYAESNHAAWQPRYDRQPAMEAQLAVAVLLRDLLLLPRQYVADRTNLARWTVMPGGGHFSAAEQPGPIAADIAAFFADRLAAEGATHG